MSKEKECKCCHEWWYSSDVKENLCPNCYDYFKQLKQQLEEKDKEIERLNTIIGLSQLQVSEKDRLNTSVNINSLQYNQKLLAIQELEKVNGILTDTIIEVTQNEFELNKLCYLEEIFAKFYEKMQEQIKELKGE